MTRRELIDLSLAVPALGVGAAGSSSIDRASLVKRHNPVVSRFDPGASLSVGNGSFAFTVDCTGLQTVPGPYLQGVPLATQAEWAWHTQPNPHGFQYKDTFEEYTTRTGRKVRYPSKQTTAAGLWFRQNPHRRGLTRIAFASGDQPLPIQEIEPVRQELELWDGIIHSSFHWKGRLVDVLTASHPQRDGVAVRVSSPGLADGALCIQFSFPYTPPEYPWTAHPDHGNGTGSTEPIRPPTDEKWTLEVRAEPTRLTVKHNADADYYFATLRYPSTASLRRSGPEAFTLTTPNPMLDFTVEFTPETPGALPLDTAATLSASRRHWNAFWSGAGCLDVSGSTDSRAGEMERRAVLSQYLTAIQCSGRLPPQETGLTGNSWYGKFHGEMHWWHAAHFPLWGRAALLERSMSWYGHILPAAKEYARQQGYRGGARWPKQCGPEGRSSPSTIGPFLIWQQPHLIYFSELLYREHPTAETLIRYSKIVEETATFMASYAEFDPQEGRYFLGPPVIPAQESYRRQSTWNPTYELSYWAWGLRVAQTWRERQKRPRHAEWDRVLHHLSPLPVHGGLYIGAESMPDFWEINRRDHPSFLAAFGILPGDLVNRETMRRSFQKTLDTWPMDQTWSWDYPMMAMTATRLGEPELAVNSLLMNTKNNTYSNNGHCFQRPRLACYLPGNGGFLSALALMAAGWEGGPRNAPGFPANRKWQVKSAGLRPLL